MENGYIQSFGDKLHVQGCILFDKDLISIAYYLPDNNMYSVMNLD